MCICAHGGLHMQYCCSVDFAVNHPDQWLAPCPTATTTTKKPKKKKSCFPSTAKVTLEDRSLVTMSERKIGDKVQTGKWFGMVSL